MRSKLFVFLIFTLFVFGCDKRPETAKKADKTAHGMANESYYTCSMHPQIHEHGPGNCPICGMPLIPVTGKKEQKSEPTGLLPSDYQKSVMQLTQGKVERKEISFEVEAGGRLLDSSRVAFYIYEADLMRIRPGLLFEGECSSMPGVILKGKIVSVDTVADPASRAVRVVGNITSSHNLKLMEGSFFGKILTAPHDVLVVPYEAVLRTGKNDIVYRIREDGSLLATPVTVGSVKGDLIEIISGIEEGEVISFGPNFLIDSESRLKGVE